MYINFPFPLRYQYLKEFDSAMQFLDEKFNFMTQGPGYVSRKHEGDKVFVFDRGGLLWIFNFHPNKVGCSQLPAIIVISFCSVLQSFADYKVGVGEAGKYKIALDSDDSKFDGHGRVDLNSEYHTTPENWDGRPNSLMVYIPSRAALVLHRSD